MKHAWLAAPLLALAATPAAAQTRAVVTASATVVVPLDTRPPAARPAPAAGPDAALGGRAAGAITVTLPDGAVCSAAASTAAPARIPCAPDPRRARTVVVVTA